MMIELEKNPLWHILVEAVQRLPMYNSHKAYVRDSLLVDYPEMTVEELSQRLDVPVGEAMVILQELRAEEEPKKRRDDSSS